MQFPNRVRMALQKTVPFSSPFGAVCGAYSIRPYNRVRAALQKNVLFSSPSGPSVGRMQYAPTAGYVRSFEILMRSSDWVRAALRKTISFPSPSGPSVGRMQYAPTTGYVRGFKKWICIRHRRWRLVGVFDTPLQPGTCAPSKYRCNPYNRVRVTL